MFAAVISRRWIRWLIRLAGYGAFLVLCLLLSSRWWLPAVLPQALGQFGVVVAAVERGPDGGLLVSDLVVETEGARVRVDAVRLPNEMSYLWQAFSGEWSEASTVKVGRVAVELLEGASEAAAGEPTYFPELHGKVEQGLALADRWVPPIRVEAVEVVRGGALLFSLEEASFVARYLAGSLSLAGLPGLPGTIEVRAEMGAQAPWTLGLRPAAQAAPALGLNVEIEAVDDVVRVAGQVRQLGSELTFAADFGASDWLPSRAEVVSAGFKVDAAWLPAVAGIAWERVEFAGVDLNWEAGSYRGTLRAEAQVVSEALGPDTLTADLALAGDLETLRVETCEVLASWVILSLSEPIEIDLRDGSVAERAVVRAELDLAKQAFVEASGRVEARLSVAPSLEGGPDVGFELNASALDFREYAVGRAGASGRLRGDVLSVGQLQVQPVAGADGTGLTASGAANLASRELDFDYALALPADWLNAQIGQDVLAGALETEGQLGGVFARPTVAGQLAPLTMDLPEVVPIALAGSYRLEGADQLSLAGSLTANDAVIETALDVRLLDDRVAVDLERLIWMDPARSSLELRAPTRLSYRFGGDSDAVESRLVVAAFDLAGPDLGIAGRWDADDGLELALRNVSVQRVGRWFERELPEVLIESVAVALPKVRPQVLGSVAIVAAGNLAGAGAPLGLELRAQLAEDGFSADTLRLNFDGGQLIEGNLAVPLTFQIPEAGGDFWSWSSTGVLEGALSGAVNPGFSDWLAQNTGVKVKAAAVDLELSGTLRQPVARFDLRVDSLQTAIARVPAMDRIELVVAGNPEQIKIEQLNFLINQSELSGAFSLPAAGLVEALQGGAEAWRTWLAGGAGRMELIDWQAEDWVDVLPAMMRRSGRLDGLLELRPNWDLRGSLSFADFALRPTASLPSVDTIGGQIELADRRLSIRDASAKVGGSPVEVAGWLDADDLQDPLWAFTIAGTNVPLMRTTDMILRSDLDLKSSRAQRDETALMSGALNLRSSTLLADFDPLAPNVESGPQAKPPFFAITDPAVADWRFDLKIAGESFMRVRSPYFRTQLSANFELGGTFAEPLLIGSVRTVGGEFSFPGAKMRIASGEAFIEPSQPNAVQLDFSGTAQRASKIISMRVTQTLDDPLIQFQSTPALSNAAIVRLLATGSATGGGAGAVGLYFGQGLLGAGGLDEQLSDRLTVDVGEETSRSGRSTVGARYELSEDYSLEGEYDVYDAYNLDFIWSIFKQ